ncbi:hypothetical protein M8494_07115 [Serratia ureilytica]
MRIAVGLRALRSPAAEPCSKPGLTNRLGWQLCARAEAPHKAQQPRTTL